MIIGSGIDIIEINRIKKIAVNEKFYEKMFTEIECEYLLGRNIESTAGYFSAKEAVSKAMGTGFSGFDFKDIEILKQNDIPVVCLHNKAKAIAEERQIVSIKVSISHSREYACAVAIAEGEAIVKNSENFPMSLLKKRDAMSHKGDFGKIYIIGGSYSMSGAVALCTRAALRSGAGLVTCVVPPSIIDRVGGSVAEATFFVGNEENGFLRLSDEQLNQIVSKCDVIAVGIGMGQSFYGMRIIEYLIKNSKKQMVIDADGLNMLKDMKKQLKQSHPQIIITPHIGEMARLTSKPIEFINQNREQVAVEFALEYGCVVLLKGYHTVVTDGKRIYINDTGNPGMASGGSGDVLTGVISAFLGQGYDMYDAACMAAYIHGYGGDKAYSKYGYGLIASDIIDNIGDCLKL